MIDEYKTHYSERKHCERLGAKVLVEQMKPSGNIIVQCRHITFDGCNLNFDPNDSHDIRYFKPKSCPLQLEKIVRIVGE